MLVAGAYELVGAVELAQGFDHPSRNGCSGLKGLFLPRLAALLDSHCSDVRKILA